MCTIHNMNTKLKAFSYVPATHAEIKWLENGDNISKVKLLNPIQQESLHADTTHLHLP